jgi:hypothetical protein
MVLSRDRLGWIVAAVVMLGAVFMWRESGSARGGAMNEMAVACDPAEQAVVSRHSATAQVVVRCVPADAAVATMAVAPEHAWAAPAGVPRTARAMPAGYTITEVPQLATVPTAPRVIEPARTVRTSAPVRRPSNGTSWQKRVAIIGGSAGAGAAIGAILGGKKGAAIGAAAGGGGATLFEVLRTRNR